MMRAGLLQAQALRLRMVPSLSQRRALALLSLSDRRLQDTLRAHADSNPLLEWEESEANKKTPVGGAALRSPPSFSRGRRGGGGGDGDDRSVGEVRAGSPGLGATLRPQIEVAFADEGSRALAWGLCAMLDEAGYLRVGRRVIADELGCLEEEASAVLGVVRGFEPAGVFARDLADCLALQLRRLGLWDAAFGVLLAHLPLVASRSWGEIGRLCRCGEEEVKRRVRVIRELDPKPALACGEGDNFYVSPDLVLHEEGGSLRLSFPCAGRSSLRVSGFASEVVGAARGSERVRLAACLRTARWLTESLARREATLLAVGSSLVRRQGDFLRRGEAGLIPLTRGEVARELGMHVSTVSRAVAGKFMGTPRGTLALACFFALPLREGSGWTLPSLLGVLRGVVAERRSEGAAYLCDEGLARVLRERHGVSLARRTVAKYRAVLGVAAGSYR